MENPWADAEWDSMTPTETCEEVKPFNYTEWLQRGHDLVQGHSNVQWNLGDWLIEGEDDFSNFGFDGIPRHLLIHKKADGDGCTSEKLPNFWNDVAEKTGMGISTLKQYAQVARAYPTARRFAQLTWSHHMIVCSRERRYEYLQWCMATGAGNKPMSVASLVKYVEEQEGTAEKEIASGFVRIPLPDALWEKLKDLGKYYGTAVSDLVAAQCTEAVEGYINAEAEKLSLKLLEVYEPGIWPFDQMQSRRQRTKASGHTRRRKRQTGADFRAGRSTAAKESWERRRGRIFDVKPISIRKIG